MDAAAAGELESLTRLRISFFVEAVTRNGIPVSVRLTTPAAPVGCSGGVWGRAAGVIDNNPRTKTPARHDTETSVCCSVSPLPFGLRVCCTKQEIVSQAGQDRTGESGSLA